MNRPLLSPSRSRRPPAIAALACSLAIAGCATNLAPETAGDAVLESRQETAIASGEAPPEADASARAPQAAPQLIKEARLTVVVDDMDAALEAVSDLLDRQGGYLLRLDDTQPGGDRAASADLRVPQDALDATLDELAALGEFQGRSISVQDVTDQLVDGDARLRNLRRTEASLLELLERSGSIEDILKVNQQVSATRQQIEQLDAQLKNLRDRVAYSTIYLSLRQNSATVVDATPAAALQLRRTWNDATRSLRDLTVDLAQLGLWLLVYSPVWLVLAIAGSWGYRTWQARRSRPAAPTREPSEAS